MKRLSIATAIFGLAAISSADLSYHNLAGGDFGQDWTNINLIGTSDDWSGVSSIMGFRGDNLTALTNVDAQTVLQADDAGVVDVNANQGNPNTFTSGGVAEFELANPVVALNGSGTADAPYLQFYMNAAGRTNVTISYTLRDLDGSADNAVQQIALHYRFGGSGDWTNVAAAYVADATAGPSLLGADIPVSVSLGAWDNASELQFRVLTTNAGGNDEWVGIDDITVTSQPVPEPGTMAALALGAAMLRRRKKA